MINKLKRANFISLMLLFFSLTIYSQVNEEFYLKINITPSSGGTYGYQVVIDGSEMNLIHKELLIQDDKVSLGKTIKKQNVMLSDCKISKITKRFDSLDGLKFINDKSNLSYDVWLFEIFTKEELVVKTNSNLLHSSGKLKNIRKLLRLLMKISPDKINLKGFS